MLNIGYDYKESTEIDARYFVYEYSGNFQQSVVIYRGSYAQCLCVVGANNLYPEMTIQEIRDKTNGFI